MKQKDFEEYEKRHAELEFELKLAEEALITSKVIGYNFIPVNPWLGRLIGFDAALMLGIIYEKSAYSKHTSGVLQHEIPMSIDYVKQITGMGEERQKKAIDILIGHGLIEYWTKGAFPKRRFFSIKTGKYKEFNQIFSAFIESEINKSKTLKESYRKNMNHLREDWLEKQNQYNSINHQLEWCGDYKIPTKTVENFTF